VRLLLRGGKGPAKRKTARPLRRASTGPGTAALERARERTLATSPGGRRRAQQRAAAAPAPEQVDRPPLTDMGDDDLAALYTQAVQDGDEQLAEQVMRELDERDEADTEDSWGSEQERQEFLASVEARKAPTEREQAKRAYQDWLHAQTLRAIEATNGALLSNAGKAWAKQAGISDEAMLDGTVNRAQVKKYASEELLRWFAEPGNARMTETDFIQQWMGKVTRPRPLSEF
jgi:hypothetical protein